MGLNRNSWEAHRRWGGRAATVLCSQVFLQGRVNQGDALPALPAGSASGARWPLGSRAPRHMPVLPPPPVQLRGPLDQNVTGNTLSLTALSHPSPLSAEPQPGSPLFSTLVSALAPSFPLVSGRGSDSQPGSQGPASLSAWALLSAPSSVVLTPGPLRQGAPSMRSLAALSPWPLCSSVSFGSQPRLPVLRAAAPHLSTQALTRPPPLPSTRRRIFRRCL